MNSQSQQDQWVISTLRGQTDGYFIEMGAKDGVHFSNTYVLEKDYGWSGLCIEPHPLHYAELVKNRSCACSNSCAYGDVRKVEFWRARDGQGGIIEPGNIVDRKVKERQAREKSEIFEIWTRPLAAIFEEFDVPHIVDYFSLDVEGAEQAILTPFPFEKYCFRLMTVERPPESLCRLLLSHGYAQHGTLGEDQCFIHRTLMTSS